MLIETLHALTTSRLAVLGMSASLQQAALSFSQPGIGLIVVCHHGGGAVGVLSKSDLVRHLASSETSSRPAAELMSRNMITCTPQDDVHEVWEIMAAQKLQNLPVLDAGSRPVGILDIRDAMRALLEYEQMQEQMLSNYVTGLGYR